MFVILVFLETSFFEGKPGDTDTVGKGKVVFNPLRLGTVIVLVSSGIDFVNTPRLYSDRATR